MIGGTRRKNGGMLLGTVLLVLAAASAVYVIPSAAEGGPPPILPEELTPRSDFPDEVTMKFKLKTHGGRTVVVKVDDPSRTVVVRYTVQPRAQFPWHSHRGPVVVNIVSGSLNYLPADTCQEQQYSAGETFVDAGHGHVHSAINRGTEPMVFIATFFEAPADGPLLIPAQPAC